MSTAAIKALALKRTPAVGSALALAGSAAFLLVRLVPDIHGKPLHEDEAVAGLVAARPLEEMWRTVLVDRGGAPFHFLLAHVALAADPSADALRWLSVVFALATIALCWDLGRRLGGRFTGMTAAALAGTSQLLVVYGTFGRMYSLLAFSGALAANLFVQAVGRPTRGTALAATLGALLPLAVHPFGVFLLGAEAAVALWLWRGRPLQPALPSIALSLLAVPLLLADLRLSDRYAPEAADDVVSASSAVEAGVRAVGGAAGGYGWSLGSFALPAALGAYVLARRRLGFAVFACLGIVAPPALLAAAGGTGLLSDRLSPRHLIFVLPLWIALVAAGVDRLVASLPRQLGLLLVAAVAVVAAVVPNAVSDPRFVPTGERGAVAAPAAWLRGQKLEGDVLYPYSPVFLAALRSARAGRSLPREAVALGRAARRIPLPVDAVLIAVPLQNRVPSDRVAALRQTGEVEPHAFPSWLLLEAPGPFSSRRAVLAAASSALAAASATVGRGAPRMRVYLDQLRGTACAALQQLGGSGCQPVATSTEGTSPHRSSSR